MSEKTVQGLMQTTMENLKCMVDTNNIVGAPINMPDGTLIIPISKLAVGFGAGGGDAENKKKSENTFDGGGGGGVSVKPIGFIVAAPSGDVRFLSVSGNTIHGQILDLIPSVLNKLQSLVGMFSNKKEEEKQ